MQLFICLSFACACVATGLAAKGPLDTPDLTPYNPVEVLCSLGKTSGGDPKISPWCKNWLQCIKTEASAEGTPDAVMKAWAPADCKEICGLWPGMTAKEGTKATGKGKIPAKTNGNGKIPAKTNGNGKIPAKTNGKGKIPAGLTKAKFLQRKNASSSLGLIDLHSQGDCLKSCKNFQTSLSSCVANIMFEPGKVAAMGIPKQGGPAPDEICSKKDTPCMPDLPIKHQKCLGHKTKSVLDRSYTIPDEVSQACKLLKMNMEDCKDCPQLQQTYQSQYAAFTGGCMDQLNAYWQATHPEAGESAIPGADGCTVH